MKNTKTHTQLKARMDEIIKANNMIVDEDGSVLNAGSVSNEVLNEYADLFIIVYYDALDSSLEPILEDMRLTFPKQKETFRSWEPARNLVPVSEYLVNI